MYISIIFFTQRRRYVPTVISINQNNITQRNLVNLSNEVLKICAYTFIEKCIALETIFKNLTCDNQTCGIRAVIISIP